MEPFVMKCRAPWQHPLVKQGAIKPIMGGTRPDARWTGNEEGLAPYPLNIRSFACFL